MTTLLPYIVMAGGALAALVTAAGPLDQSIVLQAGFAISIVAIGAGAWLRRVIGLKRSRSDSGSGGVRKASSDLQAIVKICTDDPQDILGAILEIHHRFESFAMHRQELLDSLGFSAFARVMVAAAGAERAANRAHSAWSDGYHREARASFNNILPSAQEALEVLGNG